MSWYDEWVIFSDLDGTLLDHETYSWQPAAGEVARLIDHQIPLILSSSKTHAEMQRLAAEMNLRHPMIVENGAAIAWPEPDGYRIESMGQPRQHIVAIAHALRSSHGYRFSGFADWQPADLVKHAGLDEETAALSLDRHGTEPILWHDTEDRFREFTEFLATENIRTVRGGRFIHLMGTFDKSSAMKLVLQRLSQARTRPLRSMALGDSPNDAAMLEAADIAVQIRSAKSADMTIHTNCLIEPDDPGPAGWAAALMLWWNTQGTMKPKKYG